jgi:hypothetical protein
MALPSSGNSISASQINAEGERSSTANAPLSGTSSTPQNGSLVKLFAPPNSDVNQSAPHAYSEFYGKSFSTLTSYSSSDMGVFLENCPFNGALHPLNQTYYHDGTGSTPTAGDICYSDSAGTNVLAAGYYTIPPSSSGNGNRTYIKISTNQGVVDSGYPATC